MHRKRRHGVQLGIAHLANLAARGDQILGLGKLPNHGVDFVGSQAEFVFYFIDVHFATTS